MMWLSQYPNTVPIQDWEVIWRGYKNMRWKMCGISHQWFAPKAALQNINDEWLKFHNWPFMPNHSFLQTMLIAETKGSVVLVVNHSIWIEVSQIFWCTDLFSITCWISLKKWTLHHSFSLSVSPNCSFVLVSSLAEQAWDRELLLLIVIKLEGFSTFMCLYLTSALRTV